MNCILDCLFSATKNGHQTQAIVTWPAWSEWTVLLTMWRRIRCSTNNHCANRRDRHQSTPHHGMQALVSTRGFHCRACQSDWITTDYLVADCLQRGFLRWACLLWLPLDPIHLFLLKGLSFFLLFLLLPIGSWADMSRSQLFSLLMSTRLSSSCILRQHHAVSDQLKLQGSQQIGQEALAYHQLFFIFLFSSTCLSSRLHVLSMNLAGWLNLLMLTTQHNSRNNRPKLILHRCFRSSDNELTSWAPLEEGANQVASVSLLCAQPTIVFRVYDRSYKHLKLHNLPVEAG